MKTSIVFMLLCHIQNNIAAPYIPENPQTVVATWTAQSLKNMGAAANESIALQLAADYLNQANQTGNSHFYGVANAIIDPWLQPTANPELWFLKAKIEQHEHRFSLAANILKRILAENPNHNNANLMAVRISLINQSFNQAKHHCKQLTADQYMNLVAVCLLEVASYDGQLANSYALLKNMFMQAELQAPYQSWIALMLSDMAIRMQMPGESAFWLDRFPADNEVSYLTAWAETQLKLNQPMSVITRLSQLYQTKQSLEDALLLQLALAEQQINLKRNQDNNHWKQLMMHRVVLREQRQDIHHASEMAQFYLLDNNPEKAKYWAEVNWQQAQEHKDKALLDAASQAHQSSIPSINP